MAAVLNVAGFAVLLGACFDPHPPGGLPCDDNWCPPPETCFRGKCTVNAPSYATIDPCDPTAIAPPDIRFEGHLVDASDGVTPLPDVTVELSPGGSSLTLASGLFQSTDVRTDNKPVSVRMTTEAFAGYPTHVAFYEHPFSAPVSDLSLKLLTETAIASLYTSIPRKSGYATILISLRTCDGTGIAGASFSTNPAGDGILYQGGDPSKTDATGVAYVLNAPPGMVQVTTGTNELLVEAVPDTLELGFMVSP